MQLMGGSGNSRIRNGRSVAWCCAQANQRLEARRLQSAGGNNSVVGPELLAVKAVALAMPVSNRSMDVQPPQYLLAGVQTRSTFAGGGGGAE